MKKTILLFITVFCSIHISYSQQNEPNIEVTSNGVNMNTGTNKKAYYNNKEIATKEDLRNSVTAVVAASNASEAEKLHADFVCDGSGDEVEIQNAMYNFTKVILTKGDFYLSNSVYVWETKSLCGAGMYVTKIHRNFNYIDGTTGQAFISIAGNNASLRDLTLDGEKSTYNQGAHLYGIQVWRPDPTAANVIIENVLIKNVKRIPLQIWNVNNAILRNVTVIDSDLWVDFYGTSFTIDNLKVAGNANLSISNSVVTGSTISTGVFQSQGNNVRITASDINNLTISGSNNVVVGNRINTLVNNTTNSVITANVTQ